MTLASCGREGWLLSLPSKGNKARATGVLDKRSWHWIQRKLKENHWCLGGKEEVQDDSQLCVLGSQGPMIPQMDRAKRTHIPLAALQSSTITLPLAFYSPVSNVLNMLPRQFLETSSFSSALFPCKPWLCDIILSFLLKGSCVLLQLFVLPHFGIKPQFICVTSTVFVGCIFHSLLAHSILLRLTAAPSQSLAGRLIRLLNNKAQARDKM